VNTIVGVGIIDQAKARGERIPDNIGGPAASSSFGSRYMVKLSQNRHVRDNDHGRLINLLLCWVQPFSMTGLEPPFLWHILGGSSALFNEVHVNRGSL
jgi:hypothetical protein